MRYQTICEYCSSWYNRRWEVFDIDGGNLHFELKYIYYIPRFLEILAYAWQLDYGYLTDLYCTLLNHIIPDDRSQWKDILIAKRVYEEIYEKSGFCYAFTSIAELYFKSTYFKSLWSIDHLIVSKEEKEFLLDAISDKEPTDKFTYDYIVSNSTFYKESNNKNEY